MRFLLILILKSGAIEANDTKAFGVEFHCFVTFHFFFINVYSSNKNSGVHTSEITVKSAEKSVRIALSHWCEPGFSEKKLFYVEKSGKGGKVSAFFHLAKIFHSKNLKISFCILLQYREKSKKHILEAIGA